MMMMGQRLGNWNQPQAQKQKKINEKERKNEAEMLLLKCGFKVLLNDSLIGSK